MKNFIISSIALLTVNAFASDLEAPRYYSPEFSITKISPLCPKPAPGQMTCMAFGSRVSISATIGCLDKLVFHEVTTISTQNGVEIHSVAVAFANPKSRAALCYRAQTVNKVIIVPEMEENITIVNSIIEN